MSDFRTTRRKRPLDGTLRQSGAPPIWTIVGFAHVVLGAIFVFLVLDALLFGPGVVLPTMLLLLTAVRGVVAAGLILPGLWLADGQRKGAIATCAMDVLLCAMNLLSGKLFSLDVLLLAGLAAASVWVLPMLDAERARG